MDSSKNWKRKLFRWVRWIVCVLLILVLLAGGLLTYLLRASLPKLKGTEVIAGLSADVKIERDDLGVPTITANSRQDAVRTLGFLHGQERFFQMDILRRFAAGELAALFGAPLVENDISARRHRFRQVAGEAIAELPLKQQEVARAYAEGVNTGLDRLGSRPPEYWMLGTKPEPWRSEDSLLVLIAMAMGANGAPIEQCDAVLREELPAGVFDFFYPRGTEWDAALDGSVTPTAPIPGPNLIDFRDGWNATGDASPAPWLPPVTDHNTSSTDFLARCTPRCMARVGTLGSNAWAVDGSVSANGAALVASDMHMHLFLPNSWYRVRLKWPEDSSENDVIGFSLPGNPGIVAGSNGKVAWGVTNAARTLDIDDTIVLEIDPSDSNRYRTPNGWTEFEELTETIEVLGAASIEQECRSTIWGPVIDDTFNDMLLAERFVFHDANAIDFRNFELMLAGDVTEALRIASESGMPTCNFLVGDHNGNIGWTIFGRIPRRVGATGVLPVSWADGSNGWDGFLSPDDHPRVDGPGVTYVFSGNQRKLGSPEYLALCRADSPFGARAKQIRDALDPLDKAIPADMLAIQLDNRAILLGRWQTGLLKTLNLPEAADVLGHDLQEVKKIVADWRGRATADSVGYRLVRGFRLWTIDYVFEPLTRRTKEKAGDRAERRFWQGAEQPVWTLLTTRPKHLLNPRFESYDALLLAAIHDVVHEIQDKKGMRLDQATWGQLANHPIQHPLSQAVPFLSSWLDADIGDCDGGEDMPRIHTLEPSGQLISASQRLAVSPGHEDEGIFHMPGGQSGHFLSPYYRAGHEDWVKGKPTPLLPGKTKHTLTLKPEE